MPDQNQQQNPQSQWTQQNQNTNDNFDVFGWDNDIFESENLIPIDGWEKTNTNDVDDFDDDIDVDYRNENNFGNSTQDTPQNATHIPQPEIVDNPNNDDLWDFDFSDVIDSPQWENTNNTPNNDLWDFDFDSPDTTQVNPTNNDGDNFSVYDEPDSPDDYTSPDDIEDLDDELENHTDTTDTIDINTQNPWDNPNIQTNNIDDYDTLDDDFLDPDDIQTIDPISEEKDEIPPLTPQEIETTNNEISSPEIQNDNPINGPTNDEYGQNTDQNEYKIEEDNLQDIDIENNPWDENQYINPQDYTDEADNEIVNTPRESTSSLQNTDDDTFESDPDMTYIQNKFSELKFETEKIFKLVNKDYNVWFDILWANDDRQKIMYKLFIQDNAINIKKNISDKINETQDSHSLKFELKDNSLGIYIDNELLYDETKDLQDDENKNKQVIEKLNKFIFLITEEYKKISRDKKAKEKDNIKKATFREF